MAILITSEVKGQTEQGYDGMLNVLEAGLKQAPGLVMHSSHPTESGWRVIEVWNSVAQANQYFAKNVVPVLPPGIHPKRSVQDLHSMVTPQHSD
jgi:hypothetical protein